MTEKQLNLKNRKKYEVHGMAKAWEDWCATMPRLHTNRAQEAMASSMTCKTDFSVYLVKWVKKSLKVTPYFSLGTCHFGIQNSRAKILMRFKPPQKQKACSEMINHSRKSNFTWTLRIWEAHMHNTQQDQQWKLPETAMSYMCLTIPNHSFTGIQNGSLSTVATN